MNILTPEETAEALTIRNSTRPITTWPYEGPGGMIARFQQYIKDRRHNQFALPLWVECTAQHYTDQLECLPPRRQSANAFMVGECFTSDSQGTYYAVFVAVSGRYFGAILPTHSYDPARYTATIKELYGID